MIDSPKTKEEAAQMVYGAWAGRPKGIPYRPSQCAYEVWPSKGSAIPYQCTCSSGHGPAELYCKIHAKIVERQA